MAIFDHLLWTGRAIGASLQSVLAKPSPPIPSASRAAAAAGGTARDQVASSYQARYEQLAGVRDQAALRRVRRIRYALASGFAVAVLLLLPLGAHLLPLWATAFAALPLVLAIISIDNVSRCKRRIAEITPLLDLYQRRLARVRWEWMGKGDPGLDLRMPDHLSARDLDLFGDGSMFELLCDVDTPAGRETLARWLQYPASQTEAAARQDSIRSLRARTDLRESLAQLREGEASEYSWRILREWLVARPVETPRWAPLGALLLPLALIAACACWLARLLQPPAAFWLVVGIAAAEGTLALLLGGRVRSILAELNMPVRKVESLQRLCAFLRGTRLESPRLLELQGKLQGSSERIAALRRLIRRLSLRDNEWTIWFFLLMMGTTQTALSIERWRQRQGRQLAEWIAVIGEFEALMAIATYAYENPDDAFPEFADDGPLFEAADLGHPLIDPRTCVRNDITLGRETRFLLVTGSNMSGKSTLLRAVGLNATLAWMGAPVRARSLRLSQTRVCASIRIEDSLLEGASHFYAEVQRLKAILDLGRSGLPVLFLIDELFAGTNSTDRRVAAEAVLRSLANQQAIGLVTSHDLALSEIGEIRELRGANVHFTDLSAAEGLLAFDYRIHRGKLARGNALKIIQLVGLLPK